MTQRKLVEIQRQQFGMRRNLASMETCPRDRCWSPKRSFEQARGLVMTTEGRLATTREALLESEAALAEAEAQALKLWSEELAKTSSELAEVQEAIKKQADRVERLVVRAPTRGRVQHVLQRSPGEVVRPGETIARIVPLDDALVAEVYVKPDDIAAVKVQRQGRAQGDCIRLQQVREDQGRGHSHLSHHDRERRQALLL